MPKLQFFCPMISMSPIWISRKKPNQKTPGSSSGRIYANIVLYNPAQIAQVSVKMPTNIFSTINQNQVSKLNFFCKSHLIYKCNIPSENPSKEAEVEAFGFPGRICFV